MPYLMRRGTEAAAAILGLILVSFLVLAPVVAQRWVVSGSGCDFLLCSPDSHPLIVHYYTSVSLYYFKVGGVYGACGGGYQVKNGQFEVCT